MKFLYKHSKIYKYKKKKKIIKIWNTWNIIFKYKSKNKYPIKFFFYNGHYSLYYKQNEAQIGLKYKYFVTTKRLGSYIHQQEKKKK